MHDTTGDRSQTAMTAVPQLEQSSKARTFHSIGTFNADTTFGFTLCQVYDRKLDPQVILTFGWLS